MDPVERQHAYRPEVDYHRDRAIGLLSRRETARRARPRHSHVAGRRSPRTEPARWSRRSTGSPTGRRSSAISKRCVRRMIRSCGPTTPSRRATRSGWPSCSTARPSWSACAARTATTCSAWPARRAIRASCSCCSSAAPTPLAATPTAGRRCTRRPTAGALDLAELLLAAGAPTDTYARGDGGTPLVVALFWGHRDPARPGRAGRPRAGQPAGRGGARAGRYDRRAGRARRHAPTRRRGSPRLLPAARRLPVLDADRRPAGGAGRGPVVGIARQPCRGRDCAVGARREPRRRRLPRHALVWAAAFGRTDAVRALLEAGADPSGRSTFGGPDHGQGVTRSTWPRREGISKRSRCCSMPAPTHRSATRTTAARRRTGRSTAASGGAAAARQARRP